MHGIGSIFLDFNLPNLPTWFYLSLLLSMALFFQFTRLLSMRNLDILALFLPVPGLLLLLENSDIRHWGYVCLWIASGWFLLRCFWDLILIQRPALTPNLNRGGLAWLGGALFLSLVAVAARSPNDPQHKRPDATPRKGPILDQVQKQGEDLIPSDDWNHTTRIYLERTYALLCHFAIVVGMFLVGYRHFQDSHSGMAAATFYLLLPFVYFLLPHSHLSVAQWHHVWPMALLVWAVVLYRHPRIAGLIFGLAIGSVYFPVLVLPLWVSFYWNRGACRFFICVILGIAICMLFLLVLTWLSGATLSQFTSMMPVAIRDWLPWGPLDSSIEGLWKGIHWAYRMPVFLLTFVIMLLTAFWPAPKNLAHLLAMTTAILVSAQFWYANQGGVYVLWYLPLLVLMIFRPNLSNERPPPLPEDDWLQRVGRRIRQYLARFVRKPDTFVKNV